MRKLLINIYLIGMMGVGKTTVGRELAHLLRYEFVDTDRALEKRTGVSVGHIFEIEGEQGFREREARLLAEVSQKTNAVISTGGGIILRESNRQTMRKSAVVVYLRAPATLLWRRVKGLRARPLLNGQDPESAMARLLAERDPLYTAEADFIVEISTEPSTLLAKKIHALVQPALQGN